MNPNYTSVDFTIPGNSHFTQRFQVKNHDRKPLGLAGYGYQFAMKDRDRRNILTRNLTVVDATKAILELTITPADLSTASYGNYTWSIMSIAPDGREDFLYIDDRYTREGNVEIVHNPMGDVPPTITIDQWTGTRNADGVMEWHSSPISGRSITGMNVHTMAVYMTDYSGQIFVLGTLEEHPSDAWFPIAIPEHTFEHKTGIVPFNFAAKVKWVKVIHRPRPHDDGTLDKILYRS